MENIIYSCGEVFYKISNNSFFLLCNTCNTANFEDYNDFKKHFYECYLSNKNENEISIDLPFNPTIVASTELLNNQNIDSNVNNINNKNNVKEIYEIIELNDDNINKVVNKNQEHVPITDKNVQFHSLTKNNSNNVHNMRINDSECIEIDDTDDELVVDDNDNQEEEETKSIIDVTDDHNDNILLIEQPIFDCDSFIDNNNICRSIDLKESFCKTSSSSSSLCKTSKDFVECKLCEKYFNNVTELKKHHQEFHTAVNAKFFRCNICELSFSKEQSLINHKKIAHNIDILKYITFEKLKKKTIKNDSNLEKNIQPKEKSKQCNEIYSKLLKTEEIITQIDRKYCKFCGKKFKQLYHLIAHEQKHTETKKLKECSYCNKVFVKKGSLIDHERTVHTKETPYKCEYCIKCFTTSLKRDNHQNIHTGERPYKCSECDEAFITSTRKYRHMIISHSNIDRFQCKFCTKLFYTSGQRTKHEIKIHSNLINNLQKKN